MRERDREDSVDDLGTERDQGSEKEAKERELGKQVRFQDQECKIGEEGQDQEFKIGEECYKDGDRALAAHSLPACAVASEDDFGTERDQGSEEGAKERALGKQVCVQDQECKIGGEESYTDQERKIGSKECYRDQECNIGSKEAYKDGDFGLAAHSPPAHEGDREDDLGTEGPW